MYTMNPVLAIFLRLARLSVDVGETEKESSRGPARAARVLWVNSADIEQHTIILTYHLMTVAVSQVLPILGTYLATFASSEVIR